VATTDEADQVQGATGGDEFDALRGKALEKALTDNGIDPPADATADDKRALVRAKVLAARAADAADDTGASDPPPPPPPPPAPESTTGAPDSADADDSAEYPKDLLIPRAHQLLGVPPRQAAALLRDEPDVITVGAAKQRIQTFLDTPVTKTNEEG
jgi:hypothetical protein